MKKIFLILTTICSIFFFSCTNELNVNFNKDGTADFSFSTAAGTALSKMLKDYAKNAGTETLIDSKSIVKDLTDSKFTNVKVSVTGFSSFTASGSDKTKKSIIFTSGILKNDKSKIKFVLTPELLKEFYDKSEPSTQMLLDMLLSPVFNDEKMSESEYIETLSTFYGAPIGNEIKSSVITINITDSNGKKISQKIPLARLMTLNKPLILEN